MSNPLVKKLEDRLKDNSLDEKTKQAIKSRVKVLKGNLTVNK